MMESCTCQQDGDDAVFEIGYDEQNRDPSRDPS